MHELILTIVKPLVDFPEDVSVHEVEEDHHISYQLSVNKADIGKIIGKKGVLRKPFELLSMLQQDPNNIRKFIWKLSNEHC